MFERFKRRKQLRRLEEMTRGTLLAEVLTDLLRIIESGEFCQSSVKVFPNETVVGTLDELEKAIYTLHNESLQVNKLSEALIGHREDGHSLISDERIDTSIDEMILGQEKEGILWGLLCLMIHERLKLDPTAGISAREDFQLVLGYFDEEVIPEGVPVQ